MKKIILTGLVATMLLSCSSNNKKQREMKEAKVIEMVLWKSKAGVSAETAKEAISALNEFVSKQPGFVSRKTGLAENGQFVDFVLWTDLASAQAASEKAMQDPSVAPAFETIDEKEMQFNHFEIFNVAP